MPGRRVLITGGCRSGKSRYALQLAKDVGHRCYIATAVAGDVEMSERIALHRSERGPNWMTIEEPFFIAAPLRERGATDDIVVIDCLTLWTSNWLLAFDDPDRPELTEGRFRRQVDDLLAVLTDAQASIILVTNEVGWGIVPDNTLGRRFRDLTGMVNQRIAAAVDEVVVMVSGIPWTIKGGGAP